MNIFITIIYRDDKKWMNCQLGYFHSHVFNLNIYATFQTGVHATVCNICISIIKYDTSSLLINFNIISKRNIFHSPTYQNKCINCTLRSDKYIYPIIHSLIYGVRDNIHVVYHVCLLVYAHSISTFLFLPESQNK